MHTIFKNLKVIELAGVLAGPAVGTFLAELGADVTKIEPPKGDVTRSWKLKNEQKEKNISAYFSSVNYHKKYLVLDLTKPDGKEKFYSLVKDADIIITNYKQGDDIKLGTNYSSLSKLQPGLIYASINGYGEDDPKTAFDAVLQAETGFMSMNGTAASGPLKMPVALIDVLAAHQLKEGILVALIYKMKTGKGAKVSVSLYDAAISSLMNQASNWLMTGNLPVAEGSLHPNIAPYGETFETADKKYLLLAIGNDQQFLALCDLTELAEIKNENRFQNNQQRVANRTELGILLKEKFILRTASDWSADFSKNKIPHGIIKNLKEVFEDEKAKSLIETEMIDEMETKRVRNSIFKIHFE